jgi:hypothetical protein
MKDFGLSRDVPVKRGQPALLFVDVQNYSAEGGGKYAGFRRKLLKRDTDTSLQIGSEGTFIAAEDPSQLRLG